MQQYERSCCSGMNWQGSGLFLNVLLAHFIFFSDKTLALALLCNSVNVRQHILDNNEHVYVDYHWLCSNKPTTVIWVCFFFISKMLKKLIRKHLFMISWEDLCLCVFLTNCAHPVLVPSLKNKTKQKQNQG